MEYCFFCLLLVKNSLLRDCSLYRSVCGTAGMPLARLCAPCRQGEQGPFLVKEWMSVEVSMPEEPWLGKLCPWRLPSSLPRRGVHLGMAELECNLGCAMAALCALHLKTSQTYLLARLFHPQLLSEVCHPVAFIVLVRWWLPLLFVDLLFPRFFPHFLPSCHFCPSPLVQEVASFDCPHLIRSHLLSLFFSWIFLSLLVTLEGLVFTAFYLLVQNYPKCLRLLSLT